MTDGPYVRVYAAILTDEKFADVIFDDQALAWWLRLLIAADTAFPTPVMLPRAVPDEVVRKLADRQIIDLLPNDLFTVHGLAAERELRAKRGRAGADARWGRNDPPPDDPGDEPGAGASTEHPDPRTPPDANALRGARGTHERRNARTSRAENENEQSKDRAAQVARERGRAALDIGHWLEERTNYPFTARPGSPTFDKLAADVGNFGEAEYRKAVETVLLTVGSQPVDVTWVIHEAHKLLMPPLSTAADRKAAEEARKEAERQQAARDREQRQRDALAPFREAMGYGPDGKLRQDAIGGQA